MKKILFLILLITFSCKKQEEKLVNIVKVDYVSIGTKYGKLYKFFDVQETTIKKDRKSTRLNSSHRNTSRMPSSA